MIFSIFNSRFSVVNLYQSLTPEHWICLAGLILLAYWLLRTSLGAKALEGSSPRRNDMPIYLPLIPLLLWFGPVPMAAVVVREVVAPACPTGLTGEGFAAFLDNCIFIAGGIVITVVILLLARAHFARRLKGFGLNIKTVPADFLCAFANLLAVWPLIMGTIIMTQFIGEQIWGQDYQMQRHQELELIAEYPQLLLRVAIVVVAAVMAPLLEELLFRGLVQTMIRSLLDSVRSVPVRAYSNERLTASLPTPWLAIAASSGLFTLMHADPGHWPALFILGVCMGYAYEKSGSLFRPIFIHAIFNTASITAALSQS
jgi:membrane protease YdiL (CAAX protease family)